MIKALHNSIIFTFEDHVYKGKFMEKTESGLYLGFVKEDSAKSSRIGKVCAIGPDVTDINVGDRILVEALMWTDTYKVEGINYWNTSADKVLAIVED